MPVCNALPTELWIFEAEYFRAGQFIVLISFREGVNQWNESLLTLAEIPSVPRCKRCWQVHIILDHFARKSVYVGRKYEIQDKVIFIPLFALNFLSVYVICTCFHLGTNGIFGNVNIDSFHSWSPSQKQDPLPSVWLQRALHRHRRDHGFQCRWSHLKFSGVKKRELLKLSN